ncbi:MAG: Hint domain-containing protein [Pseudomonadota bacterium]
MRVRPDTSKPLGDNAAAGAARRALGIGGLTAGTNVLTGDGWCPVEEIGIGDRVVCDDGFGRPVLQVRTRTFGAEIRSLWPNGIIYVPDGALGPAEAFYLLPGQHVVLRREVARRMFDDPTLLIPAAALVGIRGICRVMPVDLLEVVDLRFAEASIVECMGGTMMRCPGLAAKAKPATPFRRRRVYSQAGAA